jgi:peptidoglycan/xylan/chitin deacetylase (PgdA/CDA1 family)
MKKALCILLAIFIGGVNMSLTRPTYDVDNVQNMEDRIRNQAATVKQLMDKTGADNKAYLEDVLLPELDEKFSIPEGGAAAMAVEAYNGTNPAFVAHKAENAEQLADIHNMQNYEINNKGRKKKGLITFISDDGASEDYTALRNIFASENVPCCTAVAPAKVGTANYATLAQLQELQNTYGWEILSHSYSHAHLTGLTDEQVEAELKDSKDWLINNGLLCQSFAVPYGEFGTREKNLAKTYYRSMRTSLNGVLNKYISSINEEPIEMHELHGIWISSGSGYIDQESQISVDDLNYFKYYIDKAYANNAWLIISMHSWEIVDNEQESLLTSIIQYAKTKLEVTTFAGALNKIGNVLEVGDFTRQNRERPHFAIGSSGKVHTNAIETIYTGIDKFKPADDLTTFEDNKVTVSLISNAYATANSFPVAMGGTYYTYKLSQGTEPREYNRQEYVTFNNDIYIRRYGTSAWEAWVKLGDAPIKIPAVNAYTDATEVGSFPKGVSYTRIQTSQAANFPEAAGGVLITYNIHQTVGELGYNWQEYHLYGQNKVYKRYAQSATGWGAWQKISAV